MTKDNNFLNDMSRLTKSAFNGMANMKRDVGAFICHYVEEVIARMRFVKRDEFEVLKKMVSKLKKDIDLLKGINDDKQEIAQPKKITKIIKTVKSKTKE